MKSKTFGTKVLSSQVLHNELTVKPNGWAKISDLTERLYRLAGTSAQEIQSQQKQHISWNQAARDLEIALQIAEEVGIFYCPLKYESKYLINATKVMTIPPYPYFADKRLGKMLFIVADHDDGE